jgi:hypothetical protein
MLGAFVARSIEERPTMKCKSCHREMTFVRAPRYPGVWSVVVTAIGMGVPLFFLAMRQPGHWYLAAAVAVLSLAASAFLARASGEIIACVACGGTEPIDDEEQHKIDKGEKERVRDEVRALLERDLRHDLERELRPAMEAALRPELSRELEATLGAELRERLTTELTAAIEQRAREQLTPEIRQSVELELREQLRAAVEAEIRPDLEARLRIEMEQKVRTELEKLVAQKREALRAAPAEVVPSAPTPTAPAVSPAALLGAPEPEPAAAEPAAAEPAAAEPEAPAPAEPEILAPSDQDKTPVPGLLPRPQLRVVLPVAPEPEPAAAPPAHADRDTVVTAAPPVEEPPEPPVMMPPVVLKSVAPVPAKAPPAFAIMPAPAKLAAVGMLTEPHQRAQRKARVIVSDVLLYDRALVEQAVRSSDPFVSLDKIWSEAQRTYNESVAAELRGKTTYLRDAFEDMFRRLRRELKLEA